MEPLRPDRRGAEQGSALDAGGGLALGALLQGLERGEVLADHRGDQLEARQLGDGVLAHEAAVAQHRDAVGDLVDLVEEVGDEQHGDALVTHPPDHGEQLLDLAPVQRRRGLVEHEDPGLDVDGTRDRDELLHGEGVGRRAPTPGRCPGAGSAGSARPPTASCGSR